MTPSTGKPADLRERARRWLDRLLREGERAAAQEKGPAEVTSPGEANGSARPRPARKEGTPS
jgi:hypothetical protein